MADPLTLAVVGAVALTEGVQFLYAQAGEALEARRESRKSEVELDPPDVFEKAPCRARVDLAAVGRLERDLRELRSAFAEVHAGVDEIDAGDLDTLERVEALRRALETVYHAPFTFRGEPARAAAVATAHGEVDVDEVLGHVAGLRARKVLGGSVTGSLRAGRVAGGARAVGVEVDRIG
ncbi:MULTISPECIES: hypothetical protein [Saccharothrix]|uniref:hypothetical protein n=1 Tax=Saccharothrix TaxID=2071 RepID=UPI00093900C3|nr:hypothetical protein [Saccharothrix sp. CB00851]OKI32039.1 hypothetical protein A6A25_26740 [Saccharothrix sp. CB00851]